MDALQLLAAQHRDLEDLLDEVSRARGARDKRRLFDSAADRVLVHLLLEEHFLYTRTSGGRWDLTSARLLEGHAALRAMVADLLGADDSNLTYEIKLQLLRERFIRHANEEERKLFSQLRRWWSTRRLRQIGRDMITMQARFLVQGYPREQRSAKDAQVVLS